MMTKRIIALSRDPTEKRPMQLDHWQLTESPFQAVVDAESFYPGSSHDEALARIEYLVDAHRRLGVLLGEAGIGKSTLLRVSAKRLARRGSAVAAVDATALGSRDFLWQLAAELGAAPRDDAQLAHLWRLIADRIAENRLQNLGTVLLVNDAGQAGPDVLMQIVRLARLDVLPAARWTVVLAAEPQEAAHWNESLRELVDLRIDLGPWSREETIGFVQTALVEAGRYDPVFDEDALAAIYEFSGGVPRRVVRLADFALLAGAAAEIDRIDAATVHTASGEMSWPVSSSAF